MTYNDFKLEWLDRNDFILARSSGSTGTPKDIRLSKEFVKRSALATNKFFSLGSGSHFHSCISPDYIGGKMMLVRALECGGFFSFESPSNRPLAGCGLAHISLLAVVPSQMDYILSNIGSLPEIENIIIGGSAIPADLRKKISDSGLTAYETYGMTETASHIALRRVTPDADIHFKTIGDIKVSVNDSGCLVINYPDGTSITTNDLATVYDSKEFIITGRIDDRIITGSKKIDPEELENRMRSLIDIPFMLSSVPDSKWGERLVFVVEESNMLPEGLIQRIRSCFEGYETPKEIMTVKEFPRTPSGKISRSRLKQILISNSLS